MNSLVDDLSKLVDGDIDNSVVKRQTFSHDASMFEVLPDVIVAPKNVEDIKKVVNYVRQNKPKHKDLSITVRSAGTCMSGGAVNESIILDMLPYFSKINSVSSTSATTMPGIYYRDFEKATLEKNALMPSYPASREICSVGGMVMNNAGGEKSLEYGKVENFVRQLKIVLADGNEYTMKPLKKTELLAKLKQNDFEGKIYKSIFRLVEKNYDVIKSAKPGVSKDATGYHIWDVWDRETGIFDITRLVTGSQGTLGVLTEVTLGLVPARKHSGTLVVFLREIDDLGDFVNDVMKHKPATFEGFDNYTLILSIRLFFNFYKTIGILNTINLAFRLLPSLLKLTKGIPKMVLLIEFDGDSAEDVARRVHEMRIALKRYNHEAVFEEDETEMKSRKFWIMRHESFNLLRNKVKDKHTAPFMDDLIVPPSVLPKFLPEIRRVIDKYKFFATIAGHFGDGNFHIIPLMNIERKKEKAKLEPAMREINKIVLKYKGSLSGEHNDGMIRGPWLKDMYGSEVYSYFKDVKEIFDKDNIFNPHKKTDADWKYSMSHLREKF